MPRLRMEAAGTPNPRTDRPPVTNRAPVTVYAVKGAALVAAFAITLWAATNLLVRTSGEISAAVLALLAMIGLLNVAGAVVREVFGWRRPVARLAERLDAVGAGRLRCEEFGALPANLRALRAPLLAILERNKTLEAGIKRVESEARQRVHNRTDALERRLGVLQAVASRDALTQCGNRRAMEEGLPKLIAGCRGRGVDCVLMMMDVDHFKQLNDTLGHPAGDELLRSIGQVIRSSIRDGDVPYRYGGDEFVIVLPGGDRASAAVLAERLRHLVDGLTRQHRTLTLRPQLSAGIAAISELPPTAGAADLLAAADGRLYAAKRARKVQRVA
ncbi:MAG TPA: GGDEF domain-containing protein [Tepidisphaeraceae bacterium]